MKSFESEARKDAAGARVEFKRMMRRLAEHGEGGPTLALAVVARVLELDLFGFIERMSTELEEELRARHGPADPVETCTVPRCVRLREMVSEAKGLAP